MPACHEVRPPEILAAALAARGDAQVRPQPRPRPLRACTTNRSSDGKACANDGVGVKKVKETVVRVAGWVGDGVFIPWGSEVRRFK